MTKSIQQIIDEEREKSLLSKVSERHLNSALANKAKASDPGYKENARLAQEKILQDPDMVERRNQAAKKGGETKRNSKDYQQLMTEVNRKKAESPEFSKNVSKGIKKKFQDSEYVEKYKNGRKNMNKENIIASNQSRDKLKQSEACRQGTLQSLKDPTVIANRKAGNAKKYKPCQQGTEGPVYPSRKHAAVALGVDPRLLGKWIKANKDGWRYL